MYEYYTRQSLPTREYRLKLGTALCVFNSNNGFIIENIIGTDSSMDWYTLIDKESGKLKRAIADTITKKSGSSKVADLFNDVVNMRNRIIHSFRVTSGNGEQVLATKTLKKDGDIQFIITEGYLDDFIEKNNQLSNMLNEYRDENQKSV